MSISIKEFRCKNCNGELKIFLPEKKATCMFCGSNYYVEENKDSNQSNSFTYNPNSDFPIKTDSSTKSLNNSMDIPVDIDVIIIEDRALRLFANSNFPRRRYPTSLTNWISQNIPYSYKDIIDNILEKFLYVSAMAFYQKKSYRIINSGFKTIMIDNYTPSQNSSIFLEKKSEMHTKSINEFKNTLNKYGIVPEEKIEKLKDIYLIDSVKGFCDLHLLSPKFPVINPDYYLLHFGYYQKLCEQIKEKNEDAIDKMASKITEYILDNGNNTGELFFKFTFDKDYLRVALCTLSKEKMPGCNETEIACYHESSYNTLFLSYTHFSMESLPNSEIEIAVSLLIIESILKKSVKNNKFMLDLSDYMFFPHISGTGNINTIIDSDDYDNKFFYDNWNCYLAMEGFFDYSRKISQQNKSIISSKNPTTFELIFRYCEKKEKKYNSWL